MELAVELLAHLLENRKVEVAFPGLDLTAAELLEAASYQALRRIHAILRDNSLSDADCFRQIESVIRVFERLGADCADRHDFD